MRSAVLILIVLLLGACGGPLPNGKQGVLFFQAPPDIIRSADYAITLPSHWYAGNGVLGFGVDYKYDFRGTELETSTTGGLSVLSTSLEVDYRIRLRCGGEHGKREELRVRIHSGGQTHYEDAFDITCWEPNELTFEGQGPWIAHSLFEGKLGAAFTSEQGRLELTGAYRNQSYYVELADPEGLLGYLELGVPDKPHFLSQLLFRTRGPGSNAELLLGERRITFPLEVLPDEAWQLQTKLLRSFEQAIPSRGKLHEVEASAHLPNGTPVKTLDDCKWVVRDGVAEGLPTYGCRISATTRGSSATVCAQTRGKESCLTLPP